MKILPTFLFLALTAGCYCQDFEDNMIPFRINDKFVFCDTNAVQKISSEFDYAEPFYLGYAIVADNGRYGVIDKTGKAIIPLKYRNVSYNWSSEMESDENPDGLCFSVDDNSSFYSCRGRLLKLKPETNLYYPPSIVEDFEIFSIGQKYGFISGGDTIMRPKYDGLSKPAAWRDILVAQTGDKLGIVTTDDRVLIPFDYSSILWDQENGVFDLVKDGTPGHCYYYYAGFTPVNVYCGYSRLIRNFYDMYLLVEDAEHVMFYVNLSSGKEYRR